jgi:hypothetical protein
MSIGQKNPHLARETPFGKGLAENNMTVRTGSVSIQDEISDIGVVT